MHKKFNDSSRNLLAMKNLAYSKFILPKIIKKKINKNINKLNLRNLKNENFILAYVNGTQGKSLKIMQPSSFYNPSSVTLNNVVTRLDNQGKVTLTQKGINTIKMCLIILLIGLFICLKIALH